MKTISSKQVERLEKKKKKLAALANIVQLNDKDRESSSSVSISRNQSDSESSENTKKKKLKMTASEHEEEPLTKKSRLHSKDKSKDEIKDTSSANENDLSTQKLNLTYEQYEQLKKELKNRKRELENIPIFRLRPAGYSASLEVEQDKRIPIFLTDIQHLLMHALLGKKSPCLPDRWCYIEKSLRLSHTVVLVLEGVSLYHFMANENKFINTNKIFEAKLEVVLPSPKNGSIIENLITAPLTNVQAEELINEYGSLENAIEMTKDPTLLVRSIFPVEDAKMEKNDVLPQGDKFPRTKLLLSALQMVDNGYPMPLRGELVDRFEDYKFTCDKYLPVTPKSPMFGVDCEMCKTTTGQNELTRISIVNEKFETVYETLVMPVNKIVDYLTQYSGITPAIMKKVTKKLSEVQDDVRKLLPADAILVGQSLNSDLNAMKMMHPYVIDTSVIFNLTGNRKKKSKLQALAMKFLEHSIQEQAGGHDSVEDSLASIRLVQLKLKHSIDFGDEILIQKKRVNEIIRAAMSDDIKNSLFAHTSQRDKQTAIITNGALHSEIKDICQKATSYDKLKTITLCELESNKDAVKKAREIALEQALSIVNLKVDQQNFKLDEIDKTVEKIDKWILKLWKTVAHNGLFVVVFGGSEDCPSGSVKIAIKKNAADVANEVPITVL